MLGAGACTVMARPMLLLMDKAFLARSVETVAWLISSPVSMEGPNLLVKASALAVVLFQQQQQFSPGRDSLPMEMAYLTAKMLGIFTIALLGGSQREGWCCHILGQLPTLET